MIDLHAHTNLSYCATSSLTAEFYCDQIKENPALEKIAVTDHGMAVYFPYDLAWAWDFISDSTIFDHWRDKGNEKLATHLNKLEAMKDSGIIPGYEAEMMHDGRLTLDPAFQPKIQVLIGSVHYLPISVKNGHSESEVYKYWHEHNQKLLNTGINVLGHPFRWLAQNLEVTPSMVTDIVKEARKAGVALELNCHFKHEQEDIMLLREVVKQDALVAFGTDCHVEIECGDFSYHFQILEKAGLTLDDFNFLPV
jgi:histidinol phosphatase-like PHP family hydrolase